MKSLIVEADKSRRDLLRTFIGQTCFLELVESCSRAIQALNVVAKAEIDLLILDLDIADMSWTDFLNSIQVRPLIIANAADAGYACEAFEYNVTDYLLEPYSYGRFLRAATKAKRIFDLQHWRQSIHDFLVVKSGSHNIKINIQEIRSVEAANRYVTISLSQNTITAEISLDQIVKKLSPDKFVRIHRSFVVQLEKISYFDDDKLVIDNRQLAIEKPYRTDLLKRISLK